MKFLKKIIVYLFVVLVSTSAKPGPANNHSIKNGTKKMATAAKKQIKKKPEVTTTNTNLKLIADHDLYMPSVKKIRVLLEETSAATERRFIIKSRHSFVLESPVNSGNTAVYKENEIKLLCRDKQLFLRCHDQKYRRVKFNSIEICDPNHKLTLGNTTYQGSLIFRIDPATDTLLIINKLPLEDYVYSVVFYECIPTWPMKMQKIQAIISRTYAVFLMQQAQLKNPRYNFYDIKNTNLHQVYNGSHNYTFLRKAIDETQNLIVTHKGKIALTMFDICCGGSIPALMRYKDVSKPYLNRTCCCTYCKNSPRYRWKVDVHEKEFLSHLKKNQKIAKKLKNFKGSITDIKVTDKDQAGTVHKVKIFDKNHTPFALTGNDVRGCMINSIRSLAFTIKKVRDRVVFENGKGDGHRQGLCQWGCRELVRQDWSIKSILGFYYPGTSLSRLL